jgi:hypothetical protein
MAKKYAPVGRHCHAWHVGQEIYDLADTDALRSFGLGYLSHLAADAIAHNFFVPRQLVVTSATSGLGHSYWESRFETHLGDRYARTAMDLIRLDHASSDAHLDRIISPTIFSVRTNRRLFRGMVRVTETQSWQRAFRIVAQTSRWDLSDSEVERQMAASFHLVMEILGASDGVARRLDPSGEASLALAKRLRRQFMRREWDDRRGGLTEVADEHFSVPAYESRVWEDSEGPRPWRKDDGSGDRQVGGS